MIPKFENLVNLLDPIKYTSPTSGNVCELRPQIHGRYSAGDRYYDNGDDAGMWKVYDTSTSSFLTTADENIFGETNKGYLRFGWDAANSTWLPAGTEDDKILHLADGDDYWFPFAQSGNTRLPDTDQTFIAWVWVSDKDRGGDAIGGQIPSNSYYDGSAIGTHFVISESDDNAYEIGKWKWRYVQGNFWWGDEFNVNIPRMDFGKWYCIAIIKDHAHAQGNHPHATSDSDYAASKVVYLNGEKVVNSADKFYGYRSGRDEAHQDPSDYSYQAHEYNQKPRIITLGRYGFKGRVGVMAQWDVALTEQEIRQFYNFYRSRYAD